MARLALFDPRPAAREVHENPPHHLRGDAEEVRAVLPTRRLPVDEAQVGFVNQGGGLEEVVVALAAHVTAREPVQLGLDERGQAFERLLVAVTPGDQ